MSGGILTPDQRLRVFVSSTMEELAEERLAARRAVERLELAPVMFELGARPHPPRSLYLAYLRQSHVFVGLYWQRYGWVAPGMDVSGLEDELRHSSGMPRLVYLKEPAPELEPRLGTMLDSIRAANDVSYKTFRAAEELESLLAADLAVLLTERFLAEPTGVDEAGPARWTVPAPVSDFVGRGEQLDGLVRLLTQPEPRLVTLTGPGGVGKTRLALEAGRRVASRFTDGVGFVPLAPSGPSLVATVAATLRLPQLSAERPDASVAAELLDRNALLILDNFESVLDQATEAGDLLAAAPRLRLLVTSRVALRLTGEQEVGVAPLAVPDPDAGLSAVLESEAVQLFARRAAAVRYGFSVDESNAEAVARICRRLDGLPLAIELVAARTAVMSVDELAGRLVDVLDLPTRARDVPARQRTLRATLDWSVAQLEREEQRAFARLGAFAGPFTAAAAAAVLSTEGTPDVLDLLATLVDHSLLRPSIDAGETRFSMLQTVRDYARSRLEPTETADALARHAAYYQALAVRTGEALRGGGQRRALEALDADIGNIQLAVESLLADSRQQTVADVAWALWLYCWARGATRRLESLDPGGLGRCRSASGPGAGAAAGRRRLPRHVAAGLRHCPARAEGGARARPANRGRQPRYVGRHRPRHRLRRDGRRGRGPRGRARGAPARSSRGRSLERGVRADRARLPRRRARSIRRPRGRRRRDARRGEDLRGPCVPGDRAGELRRAPAGHGGRRGGGRADRRQPPDVRPARDGLRRVLLPRQRRDPPRLRG